MRRNYFDIKDLNDKHYYGGDQTWYSSNTKYQGGCSSVAAANVLRALFQTNPSLKKQSQESKDIPPVYKKALINTTAMKDDFEVLMVGVYKVIRAIEIFPINLIYDKYPRDTKFFKKIKANHGRSCLGFVKGILKFAKKLGIKLNTHMLPTAFCEYDRALDFIKEGLDRSGSVVILTSFNAHNLNMYDYGAMKDFVESKDKNAVPGSTYDAKMKCHFATITDVIENNDEDVSLLITTWGRPALVDYNELNNSWKSIKAYESSLFYFTYDEEIGIFKQLVSTVVGFVKGTLSSIIRKHI